jgi:hypothetical protein
MCLIELIFLAGIRNGSSLTLQQMVHIATTVLERVKLLKILSDSQASIQFLLGKECIARSVVVVIIIIIIIIVVVVVVATTPESEEQTTDVCQTVTMTNICRI